MAHYCLTVPLHWQPVGPEPAQTYWLRRAVLLVVALVLGALAVRGIAGAGGGDDTLGPAAAPTPSATPRAEPTATPTVQPCTDDALTLETTSDAPSYGPGAEPDLTLTLTNTGAVPCRADFGQGAVEVLVTSGPDRVWSSDDCEPGGSEDDVVLPPRGTETARTTWPGTRSRPGCDGEKEIAEAGTYRLVGRVGELRADGAVFVLTD